MVDIVDIVDIIESGEFQQMIQSAGKPDRGTYGISFQKRYLPGENTGLLAFLAVSVILSYVAPARREFQSERRVPVSAPHNFQRHISAALERLAASCVSERVVDEDWHGMPC